MDVSKYPLEKLVFYAAGIIPGLVALVIFEQHSPGSLSWFFKISLLGYRTKLAVVLLVAFLAGNAITYLVAIVVGVILAVIGVVLDRRAVKPPASEAIAPWRDPRWRAVLKKHLGSTAPPDTPFIPEAVFKIRLVSIDLTPEPERGVARAKIQQEKLNADAADLAWSQWYDYYHQIVLWPDPRDFDLYFRWGLNLNLEAAAVYALVCSVFLPEIRHWWWIAPAWIWVAIGLLEFTNIVMRATNKWSTVSDQIKYLSDSAPKNI